MDFILKDRYFYFKITLGVIYSIFISFFWGWLFLTITWDFFFPRIVLSFFSYEFMQLMAGLTFNILVWLSLVIIFIKEEYFIYFSILASLFLSAAVIVYFDFKGQY
jgi:hypothetical protein